MLSFAVTHISIWRIKTKFDNNVFMTCFNNLGPGFESVVLFENINNLLLASLDLPFVLISISERLASSRIKLLRRDDNSPFLTLSTVPWFPAKSPTSLQTEHTYPHNSDSRSFSTKALSNYQWIKLNVLVWFSQKACFAPLMLHNSINLTTQNSKRVPTH